jgi:hypothetical protein
VVRVNTGFYSGQKRGEIPIEIEARGNENAFGFSLVFDPSKLSFVAARISDNLGVGTLHMNKLAAEKGQVGIAVALPAGTSLGPGKHQLVVLTFRALSDNQRSNLITFGDKPVAREVVDVNANAVKTRFELPALETSPVGLNPVGVRKLPVAQHYLAFLDRSAAGLEYWTKQIKQWWLR